jgi:hypothetical protein
MYCGSNRGHPVWLVFVPFLIESDHRCEVCFLDVIRILIPTHLLITWENFNFVTSALLLKSFSYCVYIRYLSNMYGNICILYLFWKQWPASLQAIFTNMNPGDSSVVQ